MRIDEKTLEISLAQRNFCTATKTDASKLDVTSFFGRVFSFKRISVCCHLNKIMLCTVDLSVSIQEIVVK